MTVTAIPNNDTDQKKEGGRLRLIIIAIVILAILGFGAYFLLKPKSTAASSAGATPAPTPGALVTVADPIQINLAQGHYLRLDFAIQFDNKAPAGGGEAATGPDDSKAIDAAINQYTNDSIDKLTLPADIAASKKELVASLNKLYDKHVIDVYFTSFVTQ